MKLTLNTWDKNHSITFKFSRYAENGNLYVGMICHDDGYPEPYSDLSVNLGLELPSNMAFIDTPNNPGIIGWLEANRLGRRTHITEQSGYCVYEVFKFDMTEMIKYTDSFYDDLLMEQQEQM